jgi:hypothetical protein
MATLEELLAEKGLTTPGGETPPTAGGMTLEEFVRSRSGGPEEMGPPNMNKGVGYITPQRAAESQAMFEQAGGFRPGVAFDPERNFGSPEDLGVSRPGESLLGPESVGNIAGGLAGTALTAPLAGAGFISPLARVGITAGAAGIGQGVGKGLELLGEWWTRKPEDKTITAGEAIKAMGWATAEGTVLDMGGSAIGGVARKALAPSLAAVGQAQKMAVEAAEKWRVDLITAQKTQKGWMAQLSSLPGRFPFGVTRVENFARKQIGQLENAVRRWVNIVEPRYSKSLEDVGNAFMSNAESTLAKGRAGASVMYDAVEQLVKQSDGSIKRFASPNFLGMNKIIQEEELKLRGLVANPATGTVEAINRNIAEDRVFKDMAGNVILNTSGKPMDPAAVPAELMREYGLTAETVDLPFFQLRALQSRLGKLSVDVKDAEARRTFTRLHAALGEDMDEIAKTVPGLGEALGKANRFYRYAVVDKFIKNETFQMARATDASKLAQVLFPSGVSIEQVRRVKKMVRPEVFNQLSAGWLLDITSRKAINEKAGELSVDKFLTQTGSAHYSPKVLKTILGKEQYRNFLEIQSVFRTVWKSRLGGANPPETARAVLGADQFNQMMQVGIRGATAVASFGTLATLGVNPLMSAAAVGFGPVLLAKLIYSKKGIAYLEKGTPLGLKLKGSATAREALRQGVKVPGLLAAASLDWPFPDEEVGSSRPSTGVPVRDVPTYAPGETNLSAP